MALQDIFVGSDQSRYAAMAIVIALIAVAFTILFSKEKIPFGQKMVIVVLMVLLSLPAMLFSLFQITCLVTGTGFRNSKWWCGAYAWFIAVLVIIYAIVIVVMSVMSLTGDAEAKKVEAFYAQKQIYDTFTSEEMFEEEKKEDVPPPPPTRPEEVPPVPTAPVMAPPATDMEMPAGGVAPTVEPFTSCGAAWTN